MLFLARDEQASLLDGESRVLLEDLRGDIPLVYLVKHDSLAVRAEVAQGCALAIAA